MPSDRNVRKKKQKQKRKIPKETSQLFNIVSGIFPHQRINSSASKVYSFVATTNPFALTSTSSGVATYNSIYFALSDIAQVATYQSLFDQYRINKIECWIYPAPSTNSEQNLQSTTITSVLDFDDANNLTSIGAANDYSSAVQSSLVNGHYRAFKPHVAIATYSGAFSSYGNVVSPWLDVASSTVQHYGVKTAAGGGGSATIPLFYYARYHIDFRNVR